MEAGTKEKVPTMVILEVVIKAYIIMTLLSVSDEIWNITNPRPHPLHSYKFLQWEQKDFYTQKINNQWVLRKYRKTDDKIKRHVRNKYWEKRNG